MYTLVLDGFVYICIQIILNRRLTMKDYEGQDKHKEHRGKRHHHGAKTFRRGRAMDFLERLKVKRSTLKQQLEADQYQEIKQVILGELKAIEAVIDEYTKHFELHEAIVEKGACQIDSEEKNKEKE